MTRAHTALAYCTLLIVAWAFVHPFIRADLEIAEAVGAPLSPFENAAATWNLWMIRSLPFLLVPGILAPSFVALRWTVAPRNSASLLPSSVAAQIWGWVWWVLASFTVGGLALWLRCLGLQLPFFAVAPPLIFASSWAYAAALHHALTLQWQRERNHQSRIRSQYLGLGAILSSVTFLAVPVGIAIPMWVAWSADRDSSANGMLEGLGPACEQPGT